MNDSCANVFCSRAGDRSGPVKNGDAHRVRQHALARDGAGAAARAADAAGDVRRRGVAAVVEAPVGSGAGARGVNGAGSKPGEHAR